MVSSKLYSALDTLGAAVNSNHTLSGIMRALRDIVVEDCGFDRAGVYTFDRVTETMHGWWGTDPQGRLEDNTNIEFPFHDPELGAWQQLQKGGHGFFIRHYEPEDSRSDLPEEMRAVRDHAAIILAAGGELVGYIAADNLLTHRPITEEMVIGLLPFVQQAAIAVQNAKLQADREVAKLQQQRVMDITLAITSHEDPETVFLQVRNAILEIGLVDRASVWILDETTARGTWGTDESGDLLDEHTIVIPIDRSHGYLRNVNIADQPYVIDEITAKGPAGDPIEHVPHAVIPLRVAGEFIGFVAVDTLLTRRRITPAMIASVMPICDQAAVAVHKSQLLSEREKVVQQQRRLMEIAVAITENADPDAVFRIVRDAVMATETADRAGVWLVEGITAHGTWGTDEMGGLLDEHGESYSLERFAEANPDIMAGRKQYVINDRYPVELSNGEVREIPLAVIALRAGNNLIGLISLDNLLCGRVFTQGRIELLLPLAKQAAVAIQNSRLMSAAKEELDRRRQVEALLVGQTHELIAARDAALAAAKAKTQFLANMSHEIRTPMNGVIGFISLLLQTKQSSEQDEYTNGAKRSAESLLSVIDDILDFSRLEAGMLRIDKRPFDLRKCLQDIVKMIQSQIDGKDLKVRCELPPDFPPCLMGDEGRIRQMATNLIANAVKFTDRGDVVVRASCIDRSANELKVLISVSDTGVGIAENRQALVFESFTQVDGSPTRRHGGAGLGLTITKQIVELMDGTIHLESKLGVGTTVTLEIPFGKPADSARVPEPKPEEDLTDLGLTVLVVEDNPVNAMVVMGRLKKWGCHCVTAENGVEALAALAKEAFDVVLMDISMPEMDGIEATKRIRRLDKGANIPIIALTAHAMPGDRERFLAAGMDDYLSKPLNFNELKRKLLALHYAVA